MFTRSFKTLAMALAFAAAPTSADDTYQTPTKESWSDIEKRLDVDDLYGRGYPTASDPEHLQGARHSNSRLKFKGRGAGKHAGIDINGERETALYPIIDNAVFYAAYTADGNNGNRILYETPNGTCVTYLHLSNTDFPPDLRKGDVLDKNTMVGRMGTTGNASTPHVHVQFYQGDGCANRWGHYDPTPYLRGDHNSE